MTASEEQRFVRAVKEAFDGETLVSVTFSKLDSDELKIKARPIRVKGNILLCAEHFMTEGRVRQENISSEKLEEALYRFIDISRRADAQTSGGSASLLTSKKARLSLSRRSRTGQKRFQQAKTTLKRTTFLTEAKNF